MSKQTCHTPTREVLMRATMETLADRIEANARSLPKTPERTELFSLAWELKQLARQGTPSAGI